MFAGITHFYNLHSILFFNRRQKKLEKAMEDEGLPDEEVHYVYFRLTYFPLKCCLFFIQIAERLFVFCRK